MIVNYSDEEIIKARKSIFLAGPTPRSEDIISWKKEAYKILKDNGFDGVVYVPEYSTMKPRSNYEDQVLWEREGLMNSTMIVFWIPRKNPEMSGFTTNVEFGYYLHTKKVLYGRPNDAEKIKYLDWLYEYDYGIKPYDNLKDLLLEAIKQVNEKVNEYE